MADGGERNGVMDHKDWNGNSSLSKRPEKKDPSEMRERLTERMTALRNARQHATSESTLQTTERHRQVPAFGSQSTGESKNCNNYSLCDDSYPLHQMSRLDEPSNSRDGVVRRKIKQETEYSRLSPFQRRLRKQQELAGVLQQFKTEVSRVSETREPHPHPHPPYPYPHPHPHPPPHLQSQTLPNGSSNIQSNISVFSSFASGNSNCSCGGGLNSENCSNSALEGRAISCSTSTNSNFSGGSLNSENCSNGASEVSAIFCSTSINSNCSCGGSLSSENCSNSVSQVSAISCSTSINSNFSCGGSLNSQNCSNGTSKVSAISCSTSSNSNCSGGRYLNSENCNNGVSQVGAISCSTSTNSNFSCGGSLSSENCSNGVSQVGVISCSTSGNSNCSCGGGCNNENYSNNVCCMEVKSFYSDESDGMCDVNACGVMDCDSASDVLKTSHGTNVQNDATAHNLSTAHNMAATNQMQNEFYEFENHGSNNPKNFNFGACSGKSCEETVFHFGGK